MLHHTHFPSYLGGATKWIPNNASVREKGKAFVYSYQTYFRRERQKSEMTQTMTATKRKRTEEEIEHEEELLEMSYISLLNMCDDGHLSRSGTSTVDTGIDSSYLPT